jgi:hypothetical protein
MAMCVIAVVGVAPCQYANLEEMKWKWNAPKDADVSREA